MCTYLFKSVLHLKATQEPINDNNMFNNFHSSADYSPPVAIRSKINHNKAMLSKSVSELATIHAAASTTSTSSNNSNGIVVPQSILKTEIAKRLAASNNELYTDFTKKSTHRSVLISTAAPHVSRSRPHLNEEEFFDPSIVFVTSYRCLYYDSKKRIRKGKLFLSLNEFIFKCSGMPFVKCRLKFDRIKDIELVKNHDNLRNKCICIDSIDDKKFVFYKFILPTKLVYNNIKSLYKKFRKHNPNDIIESVNNRSATPSAFEAHHRMTTTTTHTTRHHKLPMGINTRKESIHSVLNETFIQSGSPDDSGVVVTSSTKAVPDDMPPPKILSKGNLNHLKDSKESSSSLSSNDQTKSSSKQLKAITDASSTDKQILDNNTVQNVFRKRNKQSKERDSTGDLRKPSTLSLPTTKEPSTSKASTPVVDTAPVTSTPQPTIAHESRRRDTVSPPKIPTTAQTPSSRAPSAVRPTTLTSTSSSQSQAAAVNNVSITLSKITSVTIFIFIFMLFFVTMNFFKLNELEREITNYNS